MAHRSLGPWRRLGKHASARSIMAIYRDLDEFPTPQVSLRLLALHRKWIAFAGRLDSMTTPTLEERERPAWRWRA
jgi:hypothetical protein